MIKGSLVEYRSLHGCRWSARVINVRPDTMIVDLEVDIPGSVDTVTLTHIQPGDKPGQWRMRP